MTSRLNCVRRWSGVAIYWESRKPEPWRRNIYGIAELDRYPGSGWFWRIVFFPGSRYIEAKRGRRGFQFAFGREYPPR